MTSGMDSGMGASGGGAEGMGSRPSSTGGEPSAFPRPEELAHRAEDMTRDVTKEMSRRGWWPTILAMLGSGATVAGAMLLAQRRQRKGLMATVPSQIADASEQMMRARSKGSRSGSWWRTMLAVVAFAAAGWGIRRRFAQQM